MKHHKLRDKLVGKDVPQIEQLVGPRGGEGVQQQAQDIASLALLAQPFNA